MNQTSGDDDMRESTCAKHTLHIVLVEINRVQIMLRMSNQSVFYRIERPSHAVHWPQSSTNINMQQTISVIDSCYQIHQIRQFDVRQYAADKIN